MTPKNEKILKDCLEGKHLVFMTKANDRLAIVTASQDFKDPDLYAGIYILVADGFKDTFEVQDYMIKHNFQYVSPLR